MNFFFHEDAETEFHNAVNYYESCKAGLGIDFAQEVYSTISRVIEHPNAWSPVSENTRRCLAHRFPFSVIYRVRSDSIEIIAVADLRQRPGYWKNRK